MPDISYPSYLFHEGTNYRSYEYLGVNLSISDCHYVYTIRPGWIAAFRERAGGIGEASDGEGGIAGNDCAGVRRIKPSHPAVVPEKIGDRVFRVCAAFERNAGIGKRYADFLLCKPWSKGDRKLLLPFARRIDDGKIPAGDLVEMFLELSSGKLEVFVGIRRDDDVGKGLPAVSESQRPAQRATRHAPRKNQKRRANDDANAANNPSTTQHHGRLSHDRYYSIRGNGRTDEI